MNILICDDIKNEADRLAALLDASSFDVNTAVFQSGQEALDYVHLEMAIDVCFLDIIMPEMNGVTLADKLRLGGYTGEIVFLTTSNDFAHQAFKVKAFDYLLKPPTPESVEHILNALENAKRNADRNCLFIKMSGTTSAIPLRDISHVEVIDHIVYVRLINGSERKVHTTFGDTASQLLTDRRFIQCHRSFIVNMNDIGTVNGKGITMQNGKWVPISRSFSDVRDEMLKWMFGGEKK